MKRIYGWSSFTNFLFTCFFGGMQFFCNYNSPVATHMVCVCLSGTGQYEFLITEVVHFVRVKGLSVGLGQ